jgi:hypothetical protein
MKYNEVAGEIVKIVQAAASFSASGAQIETLLGKCSREDILDHLDYGGVIPEQFDHDSTEEKVFAKYCDALLARALTEIGFDARVLEARGDAADVYANCSSNYSLVGDAKAFRLSRTAKNQKDFKVEALNQWRAGADYACLIAPLYQYPNTTSQIYKQAVRYNVTLLSYTHLAFMIRSEKANPKNLSELWLVGSTLTETGRAEAYRAAIRGVMLKLSGKTNEDWERAVHDNTARLQEQAAAEIRYWEEKKETFETLDRKAAVKELIKALKIDSKITVIRRTGGL